MNYEIEKIQTGTKREILLHYTGDGWKTAKLTPEQYETYKRGELDITLLDWK